MSTAELLTTNQAFLDEDYEIVNDERLEIPAVGAYEATLASLLSQYLSNAGQQLGAGRSVTEVLFVLQREPKVHRRADVAFVSETQWGAGPPRGENAWDVVPELAVEVVSSTNLAEEIESRLLDYLSAGVKQFWILHPETRRMYVHESVTDVRVITESGSITWESMLPGFSLPLAQLFSEMQSRRQS